MRMTRTASMPWPGDVGTLDPAPNGRGIGIARAGLSAVWARLVTLPDRGDAAEELPETFYQFPCF